MQDEDERVAKTRRAIRDHLLASDPTVRQAAWRHFPGLYHDVDLYPYLDLIDSYAGISGSADGVHYIADWIEVQFAPRPRRLELLARAVRFGDEKLPRGTTFLRMSAVRLAALQGLEELRPAVAEYLAAHEPERIRQRRLQAVPALLELCAGADNLFDAPRVAFSRILEMREATLEEKMSDEGFREAFFDLVGYARRYRQIADRASEATSLLRRIITRQLADRRQPPEPFDYGGTCFAPNDSGDWLAQLRRTVGP